jgi:hypothetical protein
MPSTLPLVAASSQWLILTKSSALTTSSAILAGTFALLVWTAARNRQHKVQDDLGRIADLNHRVRNALTPDFLFEVEAVAVMMAATPVFMRL